MLMKVSVPVAAPAIVGSKVTANAAVCFGLRVSGKVRPLEIAKPLPAIEAAVMVSGMFPDEVSVSDCVIAVFVRTLPNARPVELTFSAAVGTFRLSFRLADTPFAVPVRVAVCAVVTAEAVTMKTAVADPLGTVMDAGTVTALLLLERSTVKPPLPAAEVRVTLQDSVTAPVSDVLLQETTLSAGGTWPVPPTLPVCIPRAESVRQQRIGSGRRESATE